MTFGWYDLILIPVAILVVSFIRISLVCAQGAALCCEPRQIRRHRTASGYRCSRGRQRQSVSEPARVEAVGEMNQNALLVFGPAWNRVFRFPPRHYYPVEAFA